jgi:hypothetical protein
MRRRSRTGVGGVVLADIRMRGVVFMDMSIIGRLESDIGRIHGDIARVRDKLEKMEHERNEDRIRRAEELSQLRVSISANQNQAHVLKEGLGRLTTHSTWLVRLMLGGFVAALLQFTIKGGLIGGL